MVAFAVGCFVVAALFGVMAARPSATWWRLNAWSYRNPEANEPSDTSYAISSLVSGIVALALAGFGVYALTIGRSQEDDRRRWVEERADCEAVMDEMEDAFTDVDHLGPVRARARDLGVRIVVETVAVNAGTSSAEVRYVKVMSGDEVFGTISSGIARRACTT